MIYLLKKKKEEKKKQITYNKIVISLHSIFLSETGQCKI